MKIYSDENLKGLSPANEASIAFVWEHEGHRILFMGDAAAQQVATKLAEVYAELSKPVLFDAIKVSHHGSAHSTSKELMNIADSEHYFVTGQQVPDPATKPWGGLFANLSFDNYILFPIVSFGVMVVCTYTTKWIEGKTSFCYWLLGKYKYYFKIKEYD